MNKKRYGIFTTISMIVGIVIGSGIYFRADDIFIYTNGNLGLGIIVLTLGAVCIVFGGVSFAEFSKDYVPEGGVVSFFEKFVSKRFAYGYAWFQLFIWMPTVSVVVSWAAALYTFMLLGIEASFFHQVVLALGYNLTLIFVNYFSRYFGGLIQRLSTIIKLLPLFIIAIYGMFFSEPISISNIFGENFIKEFSNYGWLTALVPLAYSYDGWMIALNIAPEVVNPKKNMTRALVLSLFFILLVYLLYIIGISNLLGSSKILELGDSAVFEAGKIILGNRGANILLSIIVISVLGVANGVCLGAIRLPQRFASKGIIPSFGMKKSQVESEELQLRGIIIYAILVTIWTVIHYFVMEYQIFNGRDISEISIVFSYISYILIYIKVFMKLKEEGKKLKLIIPIMAILGSLMIFLGSLIASPKYVSLFIGICVVSIIIGYKFQEKELE